MYHYQCIVTAYFCTLEILSLTYLCSVIYHDRFYNV